MKKYVGIILLFLVVSCGDHPSKDTPSIAGKEVDAAKEKEVVNTSVSDALPILNFSELEQTYLQPNDKNALYVINFWATWCKPCVKELPYFEKIRTAYQDKNVKVVLVSLDFPEHIDKQVLPFIQKHQLKSEIVLLDDPDANSWINKVDTSWSGAIPATILVKGSTKAFYEQSFTYEALEKEIQSIL